jgi:hypothetical protein
MHVYTSLKGAAGQYIVLLLLSCIITKFVLGEVYLPVSAYKPAAVEKPQTQQQCVDL